MTSPTASCRRCGQVKPRSEFWPNLRVSTGLSSWCKDCQRAATRESRDRHRARYNAKRRKPKFVRRCAAPPCDARFETAMEHKRYCSKQCKKRAENRRLRGGR